MTDVGTMQVNVTADTSSLVTGMKTTVLALSEAAKATLQLDDSQKTAKKSANDLSESLEGISKLAKSFTVLDIGKSTITSLKDARVQMDGITYGLQAATGSSQGAKAAFEFLSKTANDLGLNLAQSSQQFITLSASASAMGVSMSKQEELFVGLARSATALHLSTEQMKYGMMALGQMFSKGKIQAEELRQQLGEAIPGVVPRFSAAVAKMTKGTALQGMSLDQLMKKGLLYTDQYLPALIEAFNETGKSAEAASNTLNANLNRLSNAWLHFRADSSEGLFNDSLNTSVRLLADHMNGVATAITGVVAAYGLLKTAQKVGNTGTKLTTNYTSATADIAATRAKNEADALAAKTSLEQVEANTRLQTSLAAIRAAKAENIAQTVKSIETEQAELVSRQANIVANQAAVLATEGLTARKSALAIAIGKVTAATRVESTSKTADSEITARLAELDVQLTANKNLLAEANAKVVATNTAVIASEQAQVVATEELAAANATLAGSGTKLSGVMGKLGSGALALAGGWWGVALIGITALVAGLAEAYESSKVSAEEFDKLKNELSVAGATATEAAAAMKDVGHAGTASLDRMLTTWASLNQQLTTYNVKLKELQTKKTSDESLGVGQADAGAAAFSVGSGDTTSSLFDNSSVTKDKQDIADLKKSGQELADGMTTFGAQIKTAVGPELWDSIQQASNSLGPNVEKTWQNILAAMTPVQRAAIDIKMAYADVGTTIANAMAGLDIQLAAAKGDKKTSYGLEYDQMIKRTADAKKEAAAAGKTVDTSAEDAALAKGRDGYIKEKLAIDAATYAKSHAVSIANAAARATEQESKANQKYAQELQGIIDENNDYLAAGKQLTTHEKQLDNIREKLSNTTTKLNATDRAHLTLLLQQAQDSDQYRASLEKSKTAAEEMLAISNQYQQQIDSIRNNSTLSTATLGYSDQDAEQMKKELELTQTYQAQKRALEAKQDGASASGDNNVDLINLKNDYDAAMSASKNAYTQQLLNAQNWKAGVQNVLNNLRTETQDYYSFSKQVSGEIVSGLIDNISNKLVTGTSSWKSYFASIAQMITSFMLKSEVVSFLDWANTKTSGSTSGVSSLINTITSKGTSGTSGVVKTASTAAMTTATTAATASLTAFNAANIATVASTTALNAENIALSTTLVGFQTAVISATSALASMSISAAGSSAGSTLGGLGAVFSANGNIMTSAGAAKLNMYKNGGIATSPQLSVFGEGSLPEAYVPLPDGRSIPVTVNGATQASGSGALNNSTQINVAVDQSGSASVTSNSSTDSTARQLGAAITQQVKQVLSNEMRQGGLLWKMQNSKQ